MFEAGFAGLLKEVEGVPAFLLVAIATLLLLGAYLVRFTYHRRLSVRVRECVAF